MTSELPDIIIQCDDMTDGHECGGTARHMAVTMHSGTEACGPHTVAICDDHYESYAREVVIAQIEVAKGLLNNEGPSCAHCSTPLMHPEDIGTIRCIHAD